MEASILTVLYVYMEPDIMSSKKQMLGLNNI